MEIRVRLTRKRVVLVGVAAALLAVGVAYAAVPDGNSVYTVCMLKSVGTVRLVDPSLPSTNFMSHCTSLETQMTWNQKGQAGLPGAAGATGPAGPAGAAGKNGVDGKDGVSCVKADGSLASLSCRGPAGVPGADGARGPAGAAGKDGADGKDGASCVKADGGLASPSCQGPAGANGRDGAVGAMGPQGPAGSSLAGSTCSIPGGGSGTVSMTVAVSGAISLVCASAPPPCPSPLPGYPHSTTGCTAGQVFITCDAGYLNSDGLIANGCEASTDTSSCPSPLPTYPNSTTQCTQIGGHVFITCNAGFGDADTLIANGCEVDFSSDANNCGGLGNAIPAPGALHANWACVAGSTTMRGCVSGFFDRNGSPVDGCEFQADPFEPNDNQNAPHSFGSLSPGGSVIANANFTPGNADWYSFSTRCIPIVPCNVTVGISATVPVLLTILRDDGVQIDKGQTDTTTAPHSYLIYVQPLAGAYVDYTLTIHV